jgi:hypothetical protein
MEQSEIEEIKKQLELARTEYDNAMNNLPFDENYSFIKMEEDLRPYSEKVGKLSSLYRLHCPITELNEIPTYGDLMSIDDFVNACKDGWFIDYDGSGNYCVDGKMTNITIIPSDVKSNKYRKEFKEIIWFNR